MGAIRKVSYLKFFIFVVFIAALVLVGAYLNYYDYYDVESLRASVNSTGSLAPLVFILIYILATVLIIPATILTVLSGFLFGTYMGALYSLIGATIGGSLTFIIARWLGRGFVSDLFKGGLPKVSSYDKKVGEHGFKVSLMVRLIVIIPYNVMNYFMGLTKVRFLSYVLGTFVGLIPYTFVIAYFGGSLGSLNPWNILISLVLLAVMIFLSWRYRNYLKGLK